MSGLELVVIAVAAVATSALTAVAGAGGGLMLLLVVLQFVEPSIAVPVFGVVQLVSNGTRAITLRADVELAPLRWFVLPLVPAALLGLLVANATPENTVRAVIGAFALVAVWVPAATGWLAPAGGAPHRFLAVGGVAGVATVVVGAPGPLLAPAFRTATSSHVAFVATFAVVGVCSHVAKLTAFALDGFGWSDHLMLMAIAATGVVVGTRLGARVVRGLDPAPAQRLFEVAVTIGAIRLLLSPVV